MEWNPEYNPSFACGNEHWGDKIAQKLQESIVCQCDLDSFKHFLYLIFSTSQETKIGTR